MSEFDDARARAAAILNDGQAPPLSPPPTAPTPAPHGMPAGMTMQEFFSTLNEYEKLRSGILQTELGKMQSIENIVAKRVETALATQAGPAEGMDPILIEGGKVLIEAFRAGKAQERNRSPPAQKPPQPTPTPAQPEKTQPAPANEAAAEVPQMMSQDDIDKIADRVEDHFPQECKDCRSGKLSKEDAVAMIIAKDPFKKCDQALAGRIYEAIMAVEEDPEAKE